MINKESISRFRVLSPQFFHLVFLVLSCLFLDSLYAQNLIQNGTFTAQPPAPWTFAPPGTQVEAVYPETTYGGSDATNIVAEIDGDATLRQTGITVVPGQIYYLSYRYARRTGNGPASNPNIIKVKVYNGSSVFLERNDTATSTTWQWICVVDSFIATTSNVDISFINVSPVYATLGTLVDDITIASPSQLITMSGQVCQGGTVTLSPPTSNGNSLFSNYSWTGPNGFTSTDSVIILNNLQANQSGTYTCNMHLNTSCLTVSGNYFLTVIPTIFQTNVSICAGEVYDFYGRHLFNTGTYDTVITGANGFCDSTIILQLTIKPLPDITTTPDTTVSLCEGDSVLLKINSPEQVDASQWYKDGYAINGEAGPSYRVGEEGGYTVVGIRDGCSDTSARILVVVNPKPTARISFDIGILPCRYDTLTLEAETNEGYYYSWTPAISFFSTTGADTPTVRGIFIKDETIVTLEVMNEFGCWDMDSVIIRTQPCCIAFAPNAFSPNNDGLNDYWKPQLGPGQIILINQIYNRWGRLVYKDTGGKGWDGKIDGENAATDTYMYYIKYTCGDDKIYEKKGDLFLMR